VAANRECTLMVSETNIGLLIYLRIICDVFQHFLETPDNVCDVAPLLDHYNLKALSNCTLPR